MSSTTSSSLSSNVVIVGGALAGNILACSMASSSLLSSLSVTLVEQSPPISTEFKSQSKFSNRTVSLTPKNVQFLKDIGAWDIVSSMRCKPYQKIKVIDSLGSCHIEFNSTDVGNESLGYIVENNILQMALEKRLQSAKNVTVVRGSVDSININENERAEVTLKDSSVIETDLVVGSDGVESQVRKLSNISYEGWDYGKVGLVATLKIQPTPDCLNNTTAWQKYLPSGPLALLPLSDTESSLVWSTDPQTAKILTSMSPEDFIQSLNIALKGSMVEFDRFMFEKSEQYNTNWTSGSYENWSKTNQIPVPSVISVDDGSRATFPLRLRNSPTYVNKRTALVGDAAHVVHPHAGQGLNLGIMDISSLSSKIEKAVETGQDIGNDLTLIEYSRERALSNVPMMTSIDLLHRIFTNQDDPFVLARKTGLVLFNSDSFIKNQVMKYAMGL